MRRVGRRGLSYFMSILIALTVTAMLGSMVYYLANTRVGSITRVADADVEAQITRSFTGVLITVTVKNTGTTRIMVDWVDLYGYTRWNWDVWLDPGQSASASWSVDPNWAWMGRTVTVRVGFIRADGGGFEKQVTTVVS